jgi:hypothetical protein
MMHKQNITCEMCSDLMTISHYYSHGCHSQLYESHESTFIYIQSRFNNLEEQIDRHYKIILLLFLVFIFQVICQNLI